MLRNNYLFASISAQEIKSRFGRSGFESIKTQGKDHPLLFLEFLIVIRIENALMIIFILPLHRFLIL